MFSAIKKIIAPMAAAAILLLVKTALAVTSDPYQRLDNTAREASYNVLSKPTFQEVLLTVIQYSLGFVGIVFIVLIIVGAYQWMTSAGNEEKLSKAKSNLKNATIGLLIVLAALSITVFIAEVMIKSTTSGYYSYPTY